MTNKISPLMGFFVVITLIIQPLMSLPKPEAVEVNWPANLEVALDTAKKNHRVVLAYFSGSDWCRPCIMLRQKVFDSQPFQTFAEKHLVLVQFDFPAKKKNRLSESQTTYNEKMAEKYNARGAYPNVVLIDEAGARIAELNGYNREEADVYLEKLKTIINRHFESATSSSKNTDKE